MTEQARRERDAANRIFGDSLPSLSGDERDDVHPDEGDERDRWLRDNVPPHHG